jgi:hypothetical protein
MAVKSKVLGRASAVLGALLLGLAAARPGVAEPAGPLAAAVRTGAAGTLSATAPALRAAAVASRVRVAATAPAETCGARKAADTTVDPAPRAVAGPAAYPATAAETSSVGHTADLAVDAPADLAADLAEARVDLAYDAPAAAEDAPAAADPAAEVAGGSTAAGAEEAAPRPGVLPALGADARAAGRSFAVLVKREAWPRSAAQYLYLGGLAGASALLEADKEALRRDVLRSSFYRHSHWTQIGGTLGLTRAGYGAAAAFYLGGLAAGQLEVRRTGLLMAESLLLAQGVAGAVNFAVSEQRPRAGGAIRYFHSGGSSVSIHMTNAMALARVLDHRLARFAPADSRGRRLAKVLGKVVIYSIPAVTGWQRLRSDQHYLWNVVLGAGLSAWVTDALLRAYDRVEQ